MYESFYGDCRYFLIRNSNNYAHNYKKCLDEAELNSSVNEHALEIYRNGPFSDIIFLITCTFLILIFTVPVVHFILGKFAKQNNARSGERLTVSNDMVSVIDVIALNSDNSNHIIANNRDLNSRLFYHHHSRNNVKFDDKKLIQANNAKPNNFVYDNMDTLSEINL